MAKTEPLLELIQALSTSEKRYFRMFSERSSGKDDTLYMALFDQIDRTDQCGLEGFTDSSVADKLAANFSYHKNYLYGQILKALQAYHLNSDRRVQMYEALTEVHLLLKKGLIDQAHKKIRLVKKNARRYHFEMVLTQLLFQERNIIRNFASKDSFAQLERVQEEARTNYEQFTNRLQVTDLYDKVFLLARNRSLRDLDIDQTLRDVSRSEKTLIEQDLSFEGRIAYHLLFSIYYQQFSENIARASFHLRSILEIYHADPALLKEHLLRYIHLLNNYFNNLYLLNDFREFDQIRERLAKLSPKTKVLQLKIRYLSIHMALLKSIQQRDQAKIAVLLPELRRELASFEEQIPANDLLMLKQSIALGYFVSDDITATLDWTQELLNESKQEIRQDARLLCLQLELLIHFQREDYSLVESRARAVIRKTNDSQLQAPNGKFALLLAKALLRALSLDPGDIKQHFQTLHSQLTAFRTYINGKQEIMCWVAERAGIA